MMNYERLHQAIFKEITRRTAQKIREAHQRGDDLRKAVEFQQRELNDGADIEQAITTSMEVFPDLDFQQELTEIMEACEVKS
jgi:hypothetical protein